MQFDSWGTTCFETNDQYLLSRGKTMVLVPLNFGLSETQGAAESSSQGSLVQGEKYLIFAFFCYYFWSFIQRENELERWWYIQLPDSNCTLIQSKEL